MKQYRFLSTGGLGDAWIVLLKINDIILSEQPESYHVDWLHVESHDAIEDTCKHLFRSTDPEKFTFSFECDPNYVQNVRNGKWKDRVALSTSVDGKCDLHGDTPGLIDPFAVSLLDRAFHSDGYDIIIQVSGGAKHSRNWKFDPRSFAAILRSRGYRVALVGNDDKFKELADPDNYVGELGILGTTELVSECRLFVGLSGFLNYYASSMRVPNIHVIESPEHDKRYYHPAWNDLCVGIEFPSMQAVLKGLEKFNITSEKRKEDWSCQKITIDLKL